MLTCEEVMCVGYVCKYKSECERGLGFLLRILSTTINLFSAYLALDERTSGENCRTRSAGESGACFKSIPQWSHSDSTERSTNERKDLFGAE